MISTRNTQSLTNFRQKASQTLERINNTAEAENLTVNGEARVVLLAPAVYDEMMHEAQLARDIAVMRKAIAQIEQGKGRDVNAVFDDLRSRLVAAVNYRKKRGKNAGRWKGTVSSSRRS